MSLLDLFRCDCHWAFCDHCHTKHPIIDRGGETVRDAYLDWQEKHKGHRTSLASPEYIERMTRRHERKRRQLNLRREYAGNANVNVAYQAEQTMTVTHLVSLANSATAGWGSAYVDNSSNLYLDDFIYGVFPAVNTAPANDKAVYLFGYQGLDTTNFTTGGAAANAGTEGTMTYPNVTTSAIAMPMLAAWPYTTQNIAFNSQVISFCNPPTGTQQLSTLPIYFGYGIINYSGMALSASTALYRRGLYLTVV